MHSRRSIGVPSLSLVLPHPPLPRRPSSNISSQDSRPSPRTPRSSIGASTPILFRLNSPRTSTDSWSSSIHDGGEDEIEWEWKSEQMALLAKTLDTLPSHLHTPFNGAIPPPNLLDKIARSITYAKGPLEWPQSIRSTRAKLLELARARAKESKLSITEHAADIPEDDILQPTTNMPKKRLYRQSSMDFLQSEKLKEEASIERLSTRLQRADRTIHNPAYHPYARPGSRSPSPPPLVVRPFSLGDAPDTTTPSFSDPKPRNSASSLSLSVNRVPRLRRSTTMISNLPSIQAGIASTCINTPNNRLRPPATIKRSESFSSPSKNGLGHTLKRAPSFGANSIRSQSSRMSVDDQKEKENSPKKEVVRKELDVYPSSDDEEKLRSKRAKKPRTKGTETPAPVGEKPKKSIKSSSVSKTGTSSPSGSVRAKKASKPKPMMRTSSMFGAELPRPQPDPSPPAAIPSPICLQQPAEVPSTPIMSPQKTLRRIKTTTFPPRPSRRISFGSLAMAVDEECEGTGLGLGSAFQMD